MRKKCLFCLSWDTHVETVGIYAVGVWGYCKIYIDKDDVRVTRHHEWCALFTVNFPLILFALENRQALMA